MTGIEARRVRVVLLAGIMCNGRLHALGSPQSLKNQHGAQVRNRLPFSVLNSQFNWFYKSTHLPRQAPDKNRQEDSESTIVRAVHA
jgi:hypothetical protein